MRGLAVVRMAERAGNEENQDFRAFSNMLS
jgi:hypothetical protein